MLAATGRHLGAKIRRAEAEPRILVTTPSINPPLLHLIVIKTLPGHQTNAFDRSADDRCNRNVRITCLYGRPRHTKASVCLASLCGGPGVN